MCKSALNSGWKWNRSEQKKCAKMVMADLYWSIYFAE